MPAFVRGSVLLLCCLCISLPPSLAQSSATLTTLRESSWALQFGLTTPTVLEAYRGYTLAVKQHRYPDQVLRGGLTLAGSHQTRSADDVLLNGQSQSPFPEGEDTFAQGRLDLQALHYPTLRTDDGPLHLYAGGGVLVGMLYQSETSLDKASGTPLRSREVSRTLETGLTGVVGAEWFPARRVSLFAEYQAAIRYQRETVRHDHKPIGTGTLQGRAQVWNVGGDGVAVGVSLFVR